MNRDETTTEDRGPQRPSLNGRWMVAITLSLFLLVPVTTYLAWSLTQGEPQRVTLDYNDRADWFMQPVTPRPLKYSTFVAAETGKQYKKTDLTLDPEVEQTLQRCVRLAKADDFFEDESARDELIKLAEQEQYGFYPPYLLASWYQLNEQPQQHERWMQVAFERAGGALVQRFIDEQGGPIAGYRLPPVAIGYDRVIDGQRDATLVLVYPAPISEANGFIYLPTFRSIYRLTDASLPIGTDPGIHPIRLTLLPQPAQGPEPNWFAVPDGAVGRFEDAVISERDRVIQETIKTLGERVEPGRGPLLWPGSDVEKPE